MNPPKAVIIGCGFAGLAAAKQLADTEVEVTIIDQSNHHLFQPLLYQVATGDLSPSEIAWPIRSIFAQAKNITVIQDEVLQVDKAEKQVITQNGRYAYDYLVVATGAQNAYFGQEQWAPHAPGLKNLKDALSIRRDIFSAFEQAERCDDETERQAYMTFVVIGGGPTGVEMAGAIAEIARSTLAKDFRHIDTRKARVVLVEGGKQLLAGFDDRLCRYAAKALQRMGVELIFDRFVQNIEADTVSLAHQHIAAHTIIWAAGVKPQVAQLLGVEAQKNGKVAVDAKLRLPTHPDIFVVGDAAAVDWQDGTVPGIAPAAKQQGQYVGRLLRQHATIEEAKPFKYQHAGNLATIGRHKAVADLKRLKFKGWPAWYFWGLIHIYFLIGVRSATVILLQWFWTYLTNRKPARLIIGSKNKDPD